MTHKLSHRRDFLPFTRARVRIIDSWPPEEMEAVLTHYALGKQGSTIKKLLESRGVSVRSFERWVKRDPARRLAYDEARRARAESLAEDCVQLADDCPANVAAVAKVREQIRVRQWMASLYDPERFGKQAAPLALVEPLHLTAVQQVNALDTAERMKQLNPPETCA